MESVASAVDQQSMVSSFLEIAVGQTAETARRFLQVILFMMLNFLHALNPHWICSFLGRAFGFSIPNFPQIN